MFHLCTNNLTIYGIKVKDLKNYKKYKNDAKLLYDQNLIREEEVKINVKDDDEEVISKSQDTAEDDYTYQDEPNVVETDFDDENEKVRSFSRSSTLYSRESEDESTLEDFEVKAVLGIGSFGKVNLVEHKKTGKLHAMKSIRKDKISDYDKVESTKLEEHILLNSEHPNIVSLDYVFKNETRIHFIMSFVRGGELFKQIID